MAASNSFVPVIMNSPGGHFANGTLTSRNRRKVIDTSCNDYVNSANKLPLKSGYMTKRSQNKKRFTPVNYKTRWFELDLHYLRYFDIENVEVSGVCGYTIACAMYTN